MSRLTATQRQFLLESQEAIENREIVFLKGFSDGKTRIINALQSVTQKSGPRHPENPRIEFFRHLQWAASDKISPAGIKRQVLYAAGMGYITLPHKLGKAWDEFLRASAKDGVVPTLAVDNAELLCEKAFSVIKDLNEHYEPRSKKNIGMAVVFAGRYGAIKAPASFLKFCYEVQVARISEHEVRELIENNFAGYADVFTDRALRALAALETTLDIHAVTRRSIQAKKELRMTLIDVDTIEEARVGLPRDKRQEAAKKVVESQQRKVQKPQQRQLAIAA